MVVCPVLFVARAGTLFYCFDETKRRDNTTPPKTKRHKTIQYFEDTDKGGGGELKQLIKPWIKLGTFGIMAIERGRRLGDG